MDGEQYNQWWMRQSFQLTCNDKTIDVRQLDIQDDQIGTKMSCLEQRFRSVCSISYDSQAGFIQKQPAQAFAYRRSIIDDQDAAGSS